MLSVLLFAVVVAAEAATPHIWLALIALAGALGTALIGGPVMWLLNRVAKANELEHQSNREQSERSVEALTLVAERVSAIDKKLDRHIEWHIENPVTPTAPVVLLRPEHQDAA